MKGKRVRIGCAAASLLMGISGTYAYYRSSVETINKIAVGDVNIGIWEYEEDGDGEKKYEGPENGIVLPSQVISKNSADHQLCRTMLCPRKACV